MKSIKHVILYPVIGWMIWMGLVMGMYALLPDSMKLSAFFVSMQTALSAAFVVLFTVLYLRKIKEGSFKEGFLVGITATAIVIILDVVHNLMMAVDLGKYFATTVPAYFIIPLTTTLVIGYLKKK